MSENLGGSKELIKKTRQTTNRLISLYIFLAVAIMSVAIIYTVLRIRSIETEKGAELQAITDEKMNQVLNWRNERIGDGQVIQNSHPFVKSIQQYIENPTNQARNEIDSWLDTVVYSYSYQSYFLLDSKGNVLFTDEINSEPLGPQTFLQLQETIFHGKVTLTDLFRLSETGAIRMDLLIPIYKQTNSIEVIAVVVFRIDPDVFLYPMIANWPINSQSGETVLFRQQGKNVIYLNSLKYQKDAALTFTVPLDTPNLPAALVLKGNRSVIFGIDYRGVPVIAVGRHIPGTLWYILAKEDESDAFAEVRNQAWGLGIIILAVITVFSLSSYSALRRGQQDFQFELRKATSEAEKLRQSYALLFEMANDIIVVLDDQNRIVDVNDRAIEAYGYSQGELLQLTGDDLRTTTKIRPFNNILEHLSANNGMRYESENKKKDGSTFPVEVSMRDYQSGGNRFILCLIRDITERKNAEIAIKENLASLKNIVEASPLAIIATDNLGMITLWNSAASTIFGFSEEEMIGTSIVSLSQKDPQVFLQLFDQNKELDEPQMLERVLNRKDGREITVSINSTLLRNYLGENSGFLAIIADVTELKKIEAENQRMTAEMQQIFKQLKMQFDNMPIGFILTDVNLKVIDWNPEAEKIFGYKRDEILGKSQLETIIPISQKDTVRKAIRQAIEFNKTEVVTHENVTKTGHKIMVEWHNTPLKDETGKTIALMAMAIDVTEKVEAEKLLKESEQKLRLFFDSNLIGIQYADIYGHIFSANDEMLKIIGYSRNDLEAGKIRWDTLTPKEFQINDQKAIKQALEKGSVEPFEKQYIRKDGRAIWVLIGFSIVDKQKGTAIAFVLDINEKKKAEQEFLAYNKLLDLVGEIGKIGGWDFDVATGAGTWTQEVALIHDLDPNDPTNREIGLSFYNPETRVLIEKAIQEAVEHGTPYNLEVELVTAKGIHKLVRMVGLPLVIDGKVTRMRGIFQDITELKKAEAEVRKLNEELEQRVKERTEELQIANQELEAFTYSVSHDLRSPLRAVDGFSKILLDENGDSLSADTIHYLQLIRKNTHNMGQLIDDLLAFSRLGRQPVQCNQVDVNNLVRNVIDQIKHDIQDRKIDFEVKNLPKCMADERLLHQVYFNLISNAVKFTRSNSNAVIEVGYKKAAPHLPDGSIRKMTGCYYVKDNGVGFDMKYYDKLFNVFQRFHKFEDYEGTGVGLAIVKRVINKHNGIVWADSTLGQGTVFYFSIGSEEELNDQSS